MIKESDKVRWYILTLPVGHRGAVKGLQAEERRRKQKNLPPLELFAPTYKEVVQKKGVWIKVEKPLLLNYVFIHDSESHIYDMMCENLGLFSYLPRVKDVNGSHYPYISDDAMKNLQWIARSYANILPVYHPQSTQAIKGDRVRITKGRFQGAEALVVIQPGRGKRNIIVSIDDWMFVPLISIEEGEYEIIEYNNDGMHLYTRLNNDTLFDNLHQALQRHHAGETTEQDKKLARKTLCEYGSREVRDRLCRATKQEVASSKLYALILQALTILGENESDKEQVIIEIQGLLERLTRAPQSAALLYATLYGCTDNLFYYEKAHALIDAWRNEPDLKKNKRQLIARLDNYDRWLGH